MRNRFALILMTGLLAGALLAGGQARADNAAPAAAANADPEGKIALADFFAGLARHAIEAPNANAGAWRQRIALLKAATILNPNDSRLQRLLADTLITIQDYGDASVALRAYDKLIFQNHEPDDLYSQTEMIDLNVGGMQTNDDKIKYLHGVLSKEPIAKEVRSFAAVRCAQLYQEQSNAVDALKMLDTALQLNPVNVTALRMKFNLTRAKANDVDRIGQLLNLEAANPADPGVAVTLGNELADLGMVDRAIYWYGIANAIYRVTQTQGDPLFARGTASELFISGAEDQATAFINSYLSTVPDDVDGWFIRLAIVKSVADQYTNDKAAQADYQKALTQAENAMVNRLQEIRKAVGVTGATTQPVDGPAEHIPDLTGDLPILQKTAIGGKTDVVDAYITSVGSLAWLEIYFRHDDAAADPILALLDQIIATSDPLSARLHGWRLLIGGDPNAATVKLSAVADSDPFAALGMILIHLGDPATHDTAAADAKKLIELHPSGPVGAMLFGALKQIPVKVEPVPKAANINDILQAFPMDVFDILNAPNTVYRLNVDPVQANYQFGEPIFARVLLQNISKHDLSLGSEGVLHSDVWLNGNLRGQLAQRVLGIGYERISQALVLHPGQSASVLVRLDDGPLQKYLQSDPGDTVTVSLSGISNPVMVPPAKEGDPIDARPSVAGYGEDSPRMMEREASPAATPDDRAKIYTQLDHGQPAERIRALEILAAYIPELQNIVKTQPQVQDIITEFTDHLGHGDGDTAISVRGLALYLSAINLSGNDQIDALNKLSSDPDWSLRMLAVAAAQQLGDKGKDVLYRRSADREGLVKLFADATAAAMAPPATQPAATQPAGDIGAVQMQGGATQGPAPAPTPATQP